MTREEAIKGLKSLVEVRRKYGDMQTMKDEIECLDMAIEALEQEPKTGHWIPVSERLPVLRGKSKISDDVLITNGFENDMGYLVERKGKIFWHYYGGEYEVCIKDEDNDATAWMPLPEPHKAESEE